VEDGEREKGTREKRDFAWTSAEEGDQQGYETQLEIGVWEKGRSSREKKINYIIERSSGSGWEKIWVCCFLDGSGANKMEGDLTLAVKGGTTNHQDGRIH